MTLHNEWVNSEIKEEIRKYLETNENITTKIKYVPEFNDEICLTDLAFLVDLSAHLMS